MPNNIFDPNKPFGLNSGASTNLQPPLDLRSPFQKIIDDMKPKQPLGPYLTDAQRKAIAEREAARAKEAAEKKDEAPQRNAGRPRRNRSNNHRGSSTRRSSNERPAETKTNVAEKPETPAVASPKANPGAPSELLKAIEKFRAAGGGNAADWAKFKNENAGRTTEATASNPALAPTALAPAGVDFEEAGKIYQQTLRKTYDGAFANLKAMGMPEYLNPAFLTKLGFDPKVDPKTISPHEYAHALATMQAREAVDKYVTEHAVSLAPPASENTVVAQNAGTTNAAPASSVTLIDLKKSPEEMTLALNAVATGNTARFMQVSGNSNLLIHDYVRGTDGRFTQLVDGKPGGSTLTTADLTARAEGWAKLSDRFATSGPSLDPLNLRSPSLLGGSAAEWRRDWNFGRSAEFFQSREEMPRTLDAAFSRYGRLSGPEFSINFNNSASKPLPVTALGPVKPPVMVGGLPVETTEGVAAKVNSTFTV